ncbi:DUF1801 domain-containing protein [Labrys neptuniae]
MSSPCQADGAMFQVTANDLATYFAFDPAREPDLVRFDGVIRAAAPALTRHFHGGTPAGEAGMRMAMIGFGKFRYTIKSGKAADWPVIGLALQKNYISLYFSVSADNVPIVERYRGRLGEWRSGRNNVSFVRFADVDVQALSALVADTAAIFAADSSNPIRYRQGG